jgi:quercetin dioxygenase-like cupin family protein
MNAKFFASEKRELNDHPRFAGVKIAILVKQDDSDKLSVSQLEIAPGIEVPKHTHDVQIDSIYIVSGQGEAFIDGKWTEISSGDYIFVKPRTEHGIRNTGDQPLRLFIHHSPPMF